MAGCSLLTLGAEIVGKSVKYEHDGITLEGFHAYDAELEGEQPGILIIHQWTGLGEYEKMAGDDISKGAAYDAKADERSWEDMRQFFAEIFSES